MQARKRPRNPAIQPLITRSGAVSVPLIRIPKKASRKNSKEVNSRANLEISGEMETTKSILTAVPIADAVVVKPMALPPCPFLASG